MAGGTVGAHVDEATIGALDELISIENRPKSQVVSVALKVMLGLSPGARRALFALDGLSTEEERDVAMNMIGRSVLKAYEALLDSRLSAKRDRETNMALDSDEAIEAAAARLCRN